MTETRPHRPVAAVAWMLATGLCFVAVQAIVKHLGPAVPAAQAAFLRYALGLVFILPMIGPMRRAGLDRRALRLAGLRAAAHTAAVAMWFYAMARIPIADVTAMNYLSPVYITIGAAVFLGEPLAARRMAAIGAALIGAAIILRPGFRELSPGHLAMLATTMAFAVSYLIAKRLSDDLEPLAVVGLLSVGVTIGLAPLAALVWVAPTLGQIGWLFLVAFFATLGHYTMTRAFHAAPLAVTQPVTFLQLVWASALGVFAFGEALDPWVVLGGTVIVAAVSFISWREAQLKRRTLTPPVSATKV
ncbi:EamA family transporter [Maritimibacter sp. 55A14]|uniref:DMT family transporter n=1 Tax=Maritimibacter sp. 55A14 TaxID=2174844 RepID=UPI000D6091F0|nr:DMT family transporter [Maritimibacter sp. 55A14]PWE33354.1 EamA family transporter [Maritimibacter sp. 55A14]